MNNKKRNRKKYKQSILEKIILDLINKSLKQTVDSALNDIFKDFK